MCIRDDGHAAALIWKSDTLENRGIATQSVGDLVMATIKKGTMAYELTIVEHVPDKFMTESLCPEGRCFLLAQP